MTMSEITYSEARARFAALWDRVVADRDVVVVRRRGKEDLAMLPAAELASLMETAHLLRSPRNAERLLAALARAREGTEPVASTQALREEMGLG